jgi:predicted nucleotide-binding protein
MRRCQDFLEALMQDLTNNPPAYFSLEPTEAALSKTTPLATELAVFVVHGHDEANALRLAALVRGRWKLRAIVLKTEPHKGRTLIGKFEQEAGGPPVPPHGDR